MSSRALRRLQKNQDITVFDSNKINVDKENSDEYDEDEDHLPSSPRSDSGKPKKSGKSLGGPINPFDLLNDEEQDENNDIKDDTGDEDHTESQTLEASLPPKSKKKKKKKKKGQEKENENADHQNHLKDGKDDVEASLQEVNRILGDPGVAEADVTFSGSQFAQSCMPLLHIDYRNLNPETELRRMFGAQVVRGDRPSQQRHRNRPVQRTAKLVQPKNTWHSTGGSGISMKYLGSDEGFTFEHSVQYQVIQRTFEQAVHSGNPQNIANLLAEHPYHIDSLVQMADFQRMNEDNQTSAELIEKALFGLESAFDVMFNLATGNCRLSYRRKENRAFHICLFKHLLNLGRKGCDRTAFEFCKLLLSLDPTNDPLNVLSVIDFYALRSMQFDFLIRLEKETTGQALILDKVNFAFSVPLAHFQRSVSRSEDTKHADLMLQDRLLMYPVVLLPLLDKCSVQPDDRLSRHAFFNTSEIDNDTRELKRLVMLYVEGCHPCWKDPDILSWLERNVHAVMDIVDEGTDPRIKDYAAKRKCRFKGATPAMLRHYVMCEIPNIGLPLNLNVSNILSTDPFPPHNSISGYRPERPDILPRDASTNTRDVLSLLLQSLNPNYNPNASPEDRNMEIVYDENEAGGAQAIPQRVQARVHDIMDAMGRLLTNLRPAANGQGNEAAAEDGADNAAEWDDDGGQN